MSLQVNLLNVGHLKRHKRIWPRESSVRPRWSGCLDIRQNLSCNLGENFQHICSIKLRDLWGRKGEKANRTVWLEMRDSVGWQWRFLSKNQFVKMDGVPWYVAWAGLRNLIIMLWVKGKWLIWKIREWEKLTLASVS